MTEIKPFRGLRYNLVKSGHPQQLVAPARIFLNEEERSLYQEKSPFNAAHLSCSKKDVQAHLVNWLEKQAVKEDEEAIFYLYEQNYLKHNKRLTCRNLIASIYPNDNDTPGQMTLKNLPWRPYGAGKLWPIRLVYDDPGNEVDELMRSAQSPFPDTVVVDDLGVEHRLFRLKNSDTNRSIGRWFLKQNLEHIEVPSSSSSIPLYADHKHERLLVSLTNAHASGLSVHPIHQLLSGLSPFKFSKLVKALGRSSTVHPLASLRDIQGIFESLQQLGESGIAFGLIGGGSVGRRSGHLVHLSNADIASIESELTGEDKIKPFSTQIVEHLVYSRGLSKDVNILRDRGQITSINDPEEAMKKSRSKDVQMLLLHTAPSLNLLRERAEQIAQCAPLSFYVFPPLIAGLVFSSD